MEPVNERFIGDAEISSNACLLQFWRWAFHDLCDDDIKGVFAEWMVATLLGLPLTRRISWANSDIIFRPNTPDEIRIEVKSSAVLQSWKLLDEYGCPKQYDIKPLDPKRVRFCGLQARTAVEPAFSEKPRSLKSSIYVFCLQTEIDPKEWNAWKLSQWEFYMMSQAELLQQGVANSISLARLRGLQSAMSAATFQQYARRYLQFSVAG
ncbi:MAG: hypothetical protein WCC25_23770 [Candidatus Korobacteraceae bacterium]